MVVRVTLEEIEQYRAELADDPIALRSLEMIEDCEGDLEDAAIALALHVGQEPDQSDHWLDGVAKRWRVALCSGELKENLLAGSVREAVRSLSTDTMLPSALATPIALYVLKTGVETFCQPLQEKL
ncbi:MAG: hypothetical protein HC781_09230 [Leptolyngbyaceae cyanobacterium CSU_1_4]|nr:hypothetical protein [Leptolyngbyaceae cyanobacterium CSU_1_4]